MSAANCLRVCWRSFRRFGRRWNCQPRRARMASAGRKSQSSLSEISTIANSTPDRRQQRYWHWLRWLQASHRRGSGKTAKIFTPLTDFPLRTLRLCDFCVKSVLPNGAVQLEHALTASQPFGVEFVVQFRSARDVPSPWTRSRPLARPSRAFTFGRIPFALPKRSSIHIDYFVPLCGIMPPLERKYGGSAKMASNRPSGYLAAMASSNSRNCRGRGGCRVRGR